MTGRQVGRLGTIPPVNQRRLPPACCGASVISPAYADGQSHKDTLWVVLARAGYRSARSCAASVDLDPSGVQRLVTGNGDRPRPRTVWRLSWAIFGRENTTRATVEILYSAIDESRRRYLAEQGARAALEAEVEAKRTELRRARSTPPTDEA